MGLTYRKIFDYQRSIFCYTKAIEIDPGHYKSYFNRAYCKDIIEDFEGALDDYKKSLEIYPGNVKALYHIGNLYEKNSKFENNLKKAQEFF